MTGNFIDCYFVPLVQIDTKVIDDTVALFSNGPRSLALIYELKSAADQMAPNDLANGRPACGPSLLSDELEVVRMHPHKRRAIA
jgi:hypothetical protein